MSDIKISVIVPAYNIASELPVCIESLLSQTYKNLEIVVVDDGSCDSTPEILDSLTAKHQKIKAIHKENGGVSSARLAGIAAATGDYIGFVDGDDTADADMFERLLENAVRYGAQISHCGYKMIYPSGKTEYYYNSGRLILQNKNSALADLISGEFVEPGLCNKLFSRELFEKAKLTSKLDTSIKINEDLLMNYYLFKECSGAVYEDFCPYSYILRKNSATTAKKSPQMLDNPLKVTELIAEDLKDIPGLSGVITERLIRRLTELCTLSARQQRELIYPRRKAARRKLRAMLPRLLKQRELSAVLKLRALWVGLLPSSYSAVHAVYARLSGMDKKYEVE